MKKIWKKERKPVRDKKKKWKLVKDRTWASPTIAVILMTAIASTIAPTAIASMDLTRPSIPTMQPQPPSKFYGTVMVDGEYVSDGTVISAWISGTQYETTTTFTYEGQSVYVIEVPGDDPDTPEVEGGVDGDTVVFKINDLTADQTGTWMMGSSVQLNLTAFLPELVLYEGWNFISIPMVLNNNAITSVLSSIQGNYDIVWAYDASDTSDHWKSYDPSAPPWSNELDSIDEKMGFWIKMICTDTLIVDGTIPMSTEIQLKIGWNSIGYPSLTQRTVTDALSSIDYTAVWSYNASDTSDHWKSYNPSAPSWVNDLDYIVHGYGYWVKMNADDILTVDA